MKEFGIVYGYYEIFKKQVPTDNFIFLRKYSTKNILIKIAEINAIILNFNTPDSNYKIFEDVFFGDLSIVKENIDDLDNKLRSGSFFVSQNISELIKEVLSNYNEIQQKDIPYSEFALDLFKTILIYNKKYNDNFKIENNLSSFKDVFTLSVLQQGYIRSTHPIVYFIKFALICKFLSIDTELKKLTASLCEKYDIGNPWNICKFLLDVYIQPDKNNLTFVLSKNSIPTNFLKEWYLTKDFLSKEKKITLNFTIIPKPLFEITEDEIIVLDFDYFQYTINQGFFFRFFEYNGKPKSSWNAFQTYLGKNYFEDFLCKLLLEKTFKHKKQIVYGDKKYQDFLVKTSTSDLLIIEAKMTSIHPNTLEDFNFETYKLEIEKNLLSQKEKQGKNKGVYQLLNQIKQLKDTKNQIEVTEILDIKNIKRLNIYPILLTDDVNYNILGTNEFINEQCSDEFTLLKKDFQSIKPVLILNVSTLIEFQGYFSSDKNCFTQLIKEYFKEISNQKRQFNLNKNGYRYCKSMQSFDTYLQRKLKQKKSHL
ncbi:hypothetical protein [Flavobacterium sp. JP2137]|uniref:hypothetical protein n=1 Tax=Flavobacterium sp. JP2137 TaxID=3414510 RepID=UPI003D2FDF41